MKHRRDSPVKNIQPVAPTQYYWGRWISTEREWREPLTRRSERSSWEWMIAMNDRLCFRAEYISPEKCLVSMDYYIPYSPEVLFWAELSKTINPVQDTNEKFKYVPVFCRASWIYLKLKYHIIIAAVISNILNTKYLPCNGSVCLGISCSPYSLSLTL